MTREIKFRAILAPVMAAIRIGGDSCRVQIDIPKSEMANVIGLAALTDVELEFTVRVANGKGVGAVGATPPAKQLEKRNRWGQYWRQWFVPNADGAAAIYATPLVDSLCLEEGPITPERIKLALRAALRVESLSRDASPKAFELYCQEHRLAGCITQSRQIVARLEEQEAER